jgi:hypothetical protein
MNFLKNKLFKGKSSKDKEKSKANIEEIKDKDENSTENNLSTNNSTKFSTLGYSNYTKSKPIPFPFTEVDESYLRMDNINLFDTDGHNINLENLNKLFHKEVGGFKITDFSDVYRPIETNPKGGTNFCNKECVTLIRSVCTEVLKEIGKKILTGDFNLTTVSFPIKVMLPMTSLQSIPKSFFQFPYYMYLASQTNNEIEIMKYLIVSSISSLFCSNFILKPLNPILGETYQAAFSDGSKVYMEQALHHPPVSRFLMYGPNKSWELSGFSNYKAGAGFNSGFVLNTGKRVMKVNGLEIHFGFAKVLFCVYF